MQVTESENRMKDPEPSNKKQSSNLGRRGFLKGAASAAVVSAIIPLEPLVGGKASQAEASVISYTPPNRANKSFEVRKVRGHQGKNRSRHPT